jgi:CspA family cold shock protein
MSNEKYVGTVIWFDAKLGYGFIQRDGEKDLFAHYSDITSEGFRTLQKGQKVNYSIGLNKSGKPKATDIVVIDEKSKT